MRALWLVAVLVLACGGLVQKSPQDSSNSGPQGQPPAGGEPTRPPTGGMPNQPPISREGTVKGILGCPIVDLPAYGIASAMTLSAPFQRNCATCHGGNGQGLKGYPSIPGKLSESEYKSLVRLGRKEMPAFDQAFVSDAQLAADYQALKSLVGAPVAMAPSSGGAAGWSTAQVEEAYQKGLTTWRKEGSVDGQACTHCHSADGVELAIIGYSDDAILRRAQQHLAAEDALAVRDFIHAQRRKLGIAKPCSPQWRPFQPGGEVLPGATAQEQDASFLKVLAERKLMVAVDKIVTLSDAQKAFAELQSVDLRQLPMGIPLPRFSEDKFNGPEHRDINDYMPAVPTAPNDAKAYFALEDDYLANPTDAKLYRLLQENRSNSNDLGYAKKYGVPNDPKSNCGAFAGKLTTQWLGERVTEPKRQGVIVTAHLLREEIRQAGSFFKRPASPFVDAVTPTNPAFFLGGFAIEPPCYDSVNYPGWIRSFPSGFRDEFPEVDLARGDVVNATDRITHPWMMLGQVLDPTLMAVDNMQTNKLHYWAFRNFVQNEVHLPFVYVHRVAMQARYWEKTRAADTMPKVSGPFDNTRENWLHPLLGNNNQLSAGLQSAVGLDDKVLPSAATNRLKGNLIRMMMLLSKELLQQGKAISSDQNDDHCLGLTCQVRSMSGYVDGLKSIAAQNGGRAALLAQGFDVDLYEGSTRALMAEVQLLLEKAPRR